MTFEHPAAFLLLLLGPLLLVGALLASRARARSWQGLVAARLRSLLVRERPKARRWIALGSFLLGFALLVTSLAGPIAGYREAPELIRGRNLLLAVDVSRSMLAQDESPTRLSAARAAALELLDRFPNDRIGIIAFSGVAWLQAPLTIDHDALRETFQQLDFLDTRSEWVPRGGSDLASAVALAVRTFEETGQQDNSLIILSDGESHTGNLEEAAARARDAGITIFAAGFGTDDGAYIPDPQSPDGNYHDRDDNLVLTRLQEESLTLLASRTGGFYTRGSGRPFSRNLEVAVQRMERHELQGRTRRIAIPRFQWFLAPSMLCFIVGLLVDSSWRRPARMAAAMAVGALMLGGPGRAHAGLIPRTPAERAFAEGDHARALELFRSELLAARGERKARLHLGEAAAAYRLRDYPAAASAYSGALLSDQPVIQEQAHFGMGNTQFLRGLKTLEGSEPPDHPSPAAIQSTIVAWRDSIAHFDAVLALNEHNQEARENRDHVRERLEELLKEQERRENESADGEPSEQPPDTPPDNPDARPGGQPPQDAGDPPPPQRPSPPDQDPPPGEPGENEAESPGEDPQPAPPDLEPRPGESPEDYARRMLRDNSDFEGRPIPLRLRTPLRPEKDW